ncbi:hypothetical protein R3W88_011409 [Solanum pinnatisectum]|uniref:Uncharacterized protein n=1 Tax=Solanum pinnatisectum TaxID=50273 RepID=A0AAV9L643_9SOLN|nr:hypothetical protein R3W88_011409 [Solanum pinnatisectum]
MKEMFLSNLNDLYEKIAYKVQQSLPNERIKKLKMTLERIMLFLRLNKHDINLVHKERQLSVEKHISFFLSCKILHKPTSSPLQGQLPQPSIHTSQAIHMHVNRLCWIHVGEILLLSLIGFCV